MSKMRILKADSIELKEKAFEIRREVFVDEQKVDRSDEFDEFEDAAHHFVVLDGDLSVGAARWRVTDKGIKLERFAIKQSYRGKGLGFQLLCEVIRDIQNANQKEIILYLHAQLPAVGLYEKAGFEKSGDQFLECDILHYFMSRPL